MFDGDERVPGEEVRVAVHLPVVQDRCGRHPNRLQRPDAVVLRQRARPLLKTLLDRLRAGKALFDRRARSFI